MKAPKRMYDGQILTVDGIDFLISLEPDQDAPPPWEDCDGHGPISILRVRPFQSIRKAPHDVYLGQYQRYQVFYDFQAAVKLARKDGWNTAPFVFKTPGEQAHNAVLDDVRYLKGYLSGKWEYMTLTVHALDDQGDILPLSASLSGVEFDHDDSASVLFEAEMLARQVIAEHSGMFAADLSRLEDVIDPDELLDPADLDFDTDYAIAAA